MYYNSVDFDAEAYDIVYGLDEAFNITNPLDTDIGYANIQQTEFEDYALFGEVTYYPTDNLSITAGLRYFEQTFYAKQEVLLPACEEFWYTTLGFFTCGDTENAGVDLGAMPQVKTKKTSTIYFTALTLPTILT